MLDNADGSIWSSVGSYVIGVIGFTVAFFKDTISPYLDQTNMAIASATNVVEKFHPVDMVVSSYSGGVSEVASTTISNAPAVQESLFHVQNGLMYIGQMSLTNGMEIFLMFISSILVIGKAVLDVLASYKKYKEKNKDE